MFTPAGKAKSVRKATPSERQLLDGVIPDKAIVMYPRIIQRTVAPEKPRAWALVSYVLFDPKKSPDPDIKGIFKIRQDPDRDSPLYASMDEARAGAEKMIRTVDSLNVYYPIEIESPYILSDSQRFVKNNVRVPVEKSVRAPSDELNEDADKAMIKMMDSYSVAETQVVNEQRSEEKKQEERIQKLRLQADKMAESDSLEHYTQLRAKYDNLLRMCRDLTIKTRMLDKFMERARETRDEIQKLSTTHPEYLDQWVAELEKTYTEVGIKHDIIKDLIDPAEFANETDFVRTSTRPPAIEQKPVVEDSGAGIGF